MSTTTLRAYLDDVAGLLEQQALEEVIGHCRHILQHFPKNLETYRILGQALLEKNRHQEASDVFQRVLGALPDDFKAHIGMSACWEELQQLPRSIWHMERAFEVDPNNRALQDELKRLMERNRQAPPARFTLSRAALARIYFNGKLYEQAISELQAARLQFSDRYDLEVLYAQSLWNAEHVTQATEQALLVLEILPDSLYANRIMAELWLRTSRPSDAKPYFIKVEQLDPFVAWDMLHEDGEIVPTDAFKLPRLQWDVRAAAALATGTPDWMANIGEVFVDPDAVDLSIPSDKRKRVWLDDFGAPAAAQNAPPVGKPRTGGLIDKYTGTPEALPTPVAQDDAPSWFKEFEKEDKQKKRSTGLSPVIPVWGDEAPGKASTPALSVNASEKSSSATADADWLFDGSDEVPPIPPAEPAESLEVRAADALSWLQNDDLAAGTDNTLPEADWLFGDDDSADAAPAANLSADMPDTLDWLTEAPPSTPKLSKLPTGDLPTVENSEDALAWLQTGSLSPDKLPPEPVDNTEIPAADSAVSAVINDPSEALAWLQTGNLSPDAAPVQEADSAPNLDWLLDESSVPPIDQQPMAASDSFEMFLDEPTQVVASDPATPKATPVVKSEDGPVAPPMAWGTDDANDSESNAFAAWLDANPEPTPAAKPNEGDQQWISELQISNALDAAALADQPVVTDDPAVADIAPTAVVPTASTPSTSDNDIDEFALMFDNLDTDLTDLADPSSPSTPAAEAEEHPMAWMMDLGLSVPAADATPAENVMEDFEPFGLTEQDPLAWMREAGLEPPPELALDGEINVGESVAPTDDEAFMASLGTNFSEESAETGLDIQSDLFAPTQNTPVSTNKQPETVIPAEPEPAPAPLLDLSDPDWLNDFQPIEVPDDELALPKTDSLAPSAASEGLDWLAAFGTVETPDVSASLDDTLTEAADAQASIDIGWLNQSAADQVTAMGSQAFSMPESKADLDVKPEASTPVAAPEPPKVEPAADDWLAGFGVIETEEPSAISAPADIALPNLDDAFSLDSLLGSIQDAPPTDIATAPTTAEDLPQSDWLSSFGFDLDTGDTGRQDEPAATLDVAPIEPVDEEPNWLAGVTPLDLPASADVASNVEDFSSFLDAFKDEVSAVPSAEVSASTEALVGDNADWLSAFGTDAVPAAEVTATPAPSSAPTTDNLGSLLDAFTMPAEASPQVDVNPSMDALLGDNADWLSALGSEETPAAKVETSVPQVNLPVTDDLDSLLDSFIGETSTASHVESSPIASRDMDGDDLDWLGGLAPTEDILAEQPTAIKSTPAADNLDFGGFLDDLADLGAGNDLPVAPLVQQPSLSDDLSDWLSDSGVSAPAALAGLDALDFSNLPAAEPDAAAPDLSALMAELGVQPDVMPPSMQSDAADGADLAPAAMPDWMASIVPPIEQSEPPSDSDLKRTTTPMDAFNIQSIEPPSEGPSSTGFTDLLRELKVGARPILPPTGALPPIEESVLPAVEAQPEAESDWLTAFVEPEIGTELAATTFDTIGATSDDEFKLELDAILAPGDMTDEAESGDELNSSTASFDIDSVTDLDLGLGTAEPLAAEVTNEDWLSSLGFTDELATVNESPGTELPAESTQTFPSPDAKAEPAVEQLVDDAWFGAMMTSDDETQSVEQQPVATEPTMSSSMFARLNPVKPEPEPTSTSVDADAPDWLRDLDSTPSSAPKADQIYNAQSVASAPDSGNTSKREEKPSSGFALPKRAPRWSRSGKTGDLDPDVLNQPRSTQSVPVVLPDVKPEVPPEKKSANAPDDDFSNLLNSLLDDTDSDLSDLLK